MKRLIYLVFGLWFSVNHIASAHDLSNAPDKSRKVLKPETLETIELSKEIPGLEGRQLRMRKIVLEPGGAIAPHYHTDRPAVVYVLQGRVREHRSDQDVPLEYGAGDTITESAAVHHWIENIGDQPLIGIVVDIHNLASEKAFSEEEVLELYGLKKHTH
ncbi:MAG: cupin domain-containing protein [Ketobacteraceae bacterium]|nr:cupin domain-containing protein [Ketobacteraceae bacterium]